MNKKVMIPLIGLALIGFAGCSDVPAPEYNAPTKSKKVAAHPAPTQFKNQGQMINYCKGMIAGEVNTKPMYVQMGRLEMDQGTSFIYGTVNNTRYTCHFDKNNQFVNVSRFAD